MAPAVQDTVLPLRFAVLPEHCEALLRTLGSHTPNWDKAAALIVRDPGLLYPILAACPLADERLDAQFDRQVAERLKAIGSELVRTWLLQLAWEQRQADAGARHTAFEAMRAAQCALHLALQTGYAFPGEAYVAGLFHNLGRLCCNLERHDTPGSEGELDDADHHRLAARMAAACGLPLPIADAMLLQTALEEQLVAAHPLARLLWAARALARDDWDVHAEAMTRLLNLSEDGLFSLRNTALGDVMPEGGPGSHGLASTQGGSPAQTGVAPPPYAADGGGDAFRRTIYVSLMRNAFSGADVDAIDMRLGAACILLCGSPAPLVLVSDDHGQIRTLPLGRRAGVREWFAELGQRLDDPGSMISLALRTGTPTSRPAETNGPGRSVHDWHLNRWLGQGGFVCLPLPIAGTKAVAIVEAATAAARDAESQAFLIDLTAAAADAVIELQREQSRQVQLRTELEQRYQEQARRMVHEASNPLTVIKSYLSLMSQRHPEAGAINEELGIVQSELDRLDRLIRQVSAVPAVLAESARCDVADVLHEMQALYSEALFGTQGIHFELRSAIGLPPVAMPASALKQVLLNLFRNAAEALQPGRRLSVVLAGQLLHNGIACVEIRVIDNGPGLPADRMESLFRPRPSAKGDTHQGLGLSIVGEILEHWNASILCRSQPGTGTSFQVLVPLVKSG
ncbi:MAG TPA: ATP-binding protein [Rhodocyclaceae bacterium]|nr:ATP-binding protein [Rhodocyclaceae bacterium]